MIAVHVEFTGIERVREAGMAQFYLARTLRTIPGVRVRFAFRLRNIFRESLVLANRSDLDLLRGKLSALGCRFRIEEVALRSDAIKRPVIIVGAPRSGTSLLFETLAVCPESWSLGMESHAIFESPDSIPSERGNRLDESDADAASQEKVRLGFLSAVHDRDQRLYSALSTTERPGIVRLLEKTPKNALRIPFLKAIFPDCRFVFIYRQPHTNLASLLDRWALPKPVTYQVEGFDWKFLLVPGWRDLKDRPVPEIAAAQWASANQHIVRDLAKLPREDWQAVRYEDFVEDPRAEIEKICQFASLTMDQRLSDLLAAPLPFSRSTLTPPSPNKWRRHEATLQAILPTVQETADAVEALLSQTLTNDAAGKTKL